MFRVRVSCVGRRTDEEEEEGSVVVVPDAVVYPHAVVVHAQDAAVAHAAMMRARWLVLGALLAVPDLTILSKRRERDARALRDSCRVSGGLLV